jgi:UTP--glucose-1-phosphate uridylyltransferase
LTAKHQFIDTDGRECADMNFNAIVKKAVIPVAGLGTRFYPITKAIPKEMLQVVDRPIIDYIVNEAFDAGIEQVILVNTRNKSSIENYFEKVFDFEAQHINKTICSVRQKVARGLGHAVLCAEKIIGNEPFAVLLGDDVILAERGEKPAIKQLIEAFQETKIAQVAIMQVPQEDIHKYGIVEGRVGTSPQYLHIQSLVEKPPAGAERSDLAVIGRYVLPASIWPILKGIKPGRGGEIQLTDAIARLINNEGLLGYRFLGHRIDAGDPLGLIELNLVEALKRPNLRAGLEEILARIERIYLDSGQ